jgi:hypothetical protein
MYIKCKVLNNVPLTVGLLHYWGPNYIYDIKVTCIANWTASVV